MSNTKNKLNNRLSICPRLALLVCGFAVVLMSQPGCQVFQRFRSVGPAAPVAFVAPPSQSEVINQIQRHAARVKQLQADVKVTLDGVPASLRGTMAIERPNRLRLKAGLLGVKEMGVDVGSNDEMFWVWSRVSIPGQQNGIFFARHDEFSSSAVRQMIPIEPRWLIDSLGLIEFDPNDRHMGPFDRTDGRVELHSYHDTPIGRTIRKTVVHPKFGYVCQQSFYGPNGRRIAYVNSTQHQYFPEFGVSLPRRIDVFVEQPGAKPMQMSVDASGYEINAIYGDANRLWAVPNPVDVPKFDLTRMGTDVATNAQGTNGLRAKQAVAENDTGWGNVDSVYSTAVNRSSGWNPQQTIPPSSIRH